MWNVYLPRYAIETRYVLCHVLPCEGTVELSEKGDMVFRTTDIVLRQNCFSSRLQFTDLLVGNRQAKFEDNPWEKNGKTYQHVLSIQSYTGNPYFSMDLFIRHLQVSATSSGISKAFANASQGVIWVSLGVLGGEHELKRFP